MMDYPGLLKLGNRGEGVKAVQAALHVETTGLFGPTTAEFVAKFQRSRGLAVDGEVGPGTWAALFASGPALGSRDLGERALLIARTYLGQHEEPRGSNRGGFVDKCNLLSSVPLGSPWCATFARRCVDEAARALGIPNPIPATGSTSYLFRWAKGQGRLTLKPASGDLGLVRGGDTGHYHTVIVAAPAASGRFPTVEGNSNDGGEPEGVEVVERHPGRRLSTCDFVRL